MQKAIIVSLILMILVGITMAQVPQLINYQGVLIDPATGDPVADASYEMVFSIYDVESGGTAIWTETKNVDTQNGLYSVMLGTTSPTPITSVFLGGSVRYLGIKVGDDPEMTPRKQIVSVAYAIVSKEAGKLDGHEASEFATKSELSTADGDPPNQGSNQVSWDNLNDVPPGFADGVDNEGTGGDNDWTISGNDMYSAVSGNVGIGTNNPSANLHVEGIDGVLFTGTYESGTIPVEGAGTRMMWYPGKAAFRVGYLREDSSSTFWDDDSIGNCSVAMGRDTRASGSYSTAMGRDTRASGSSSTAMGRYTRASGFSSTAMGYHTTASGYLSTAMGSYTRASGDVSTAMGNFARASGDASLAAGTYAKANHDGCFVWSDDSGISVADSISSTAENQFIIRATGGVGIGTTTPQGTLDVNGSIYQRGSVLHADYVFEPDYLLESIEDHAKFMWRHKHLKAIPKAKVDGNGKEIIEVGSHRRGIVEELEKAHIYIEQLHKRLKSLEEKLAQMESASKTGQ